MANGFDAELKQNQIDEYRLRQQEMLDVTIAMLDGYALRCPPYLSAVNLLSDPGEQLVISNNQAAEVVAAQVKIDAWPSDVRVFIGDLLSQLDFSA